MNPALSLPILATPAWVCSPVAAADMDITVLQSDLRSAEAKVTEMKQAGAMRWKEFEADASAATARLRKSTEKAVA